MNQLTKQNLLEKNAELKKELAVKNKELEIEAALEKVRSSALAMKELADMVNVCHIISDQLELLSVKEIRNVQTAIIYESKKTYINYEYYTKHQKELITEVDYSNHEVQTKFAQQMLTGVDELFTVIIQDKELKDWYTYQQTTNQFADFYLENAEMLCYYWYSLGPVALGMSTYTSLNENDILLFKRFRNVFELAYTRFLDIEKALAQAKEAQIEAALEKVRSCSLAMHKSSDISTVVEAVDNKLKELGLNVSGGICVTTFPEGTKDFYNWIVLTDNEVKTESYYQHYFDSTIFHEFFQARDGGLDYINKVYNQEDSNEHLQQIFLQEAYQKVPTEVREMMLAQTNYAYASAFNKYTGIQVFYFDGYLLSDYYKDILKRFSKVFEQVYIRFLDLQKAEAQAREAQIETALEKVRSRSLAMHKSTELQEVINTVFTRIYDLGIEADASGISIQIKGDTDYYYLWLQNLNQTYSTCIKTPYFEQNVFGLDNADIVKHRKSALHKTYNREEKNEWFLHMFANTDFNLLSDDRKQFLLNTEALTVSVIGMNCSNICLLRHTKQAFSEEDNLILNRFAKVFDQSYTRFLDLQKAEAQAREALIEASLERVRANAMGLRKSDELQNIITVIFEELQKLGLDLYECSIYLRKESSREFSVWGKSNTGDTFLNNYQFYFVEHPILNDVLRDLDLKIPYREVAVNKEALKSYGDLIFSQTDLKHATQAYKDSFYALQEIYVAQALFQHGFLEAAGIQALPGDLPEVLKRFSQVIDLTYTRFLDLQKAEVQAREAQIESALERVRARTMAMHKSDELTDAAKVLFEEFKKLTTEPNDVILGRGFITIIDEPKQWSELWITDRQGNEIKEFFKIHFTEPSHGKLVYDAWKAKQPYLTIDLEGETLQKWLAYLSSINFPVAYNFIGKRSVNNFIFHTKGFIGITSSNPLSQDSLFILERFARVFDITYTRFLDLQKAEAQTREAEIQLALERVRARSLAMHHTVELQEIVHVVAQQLQRIGVNSNGGVFITINKEVDQHLQLWASSGMADYVEKVYIQVLDKPIFTELREAIKKGNTFFDKVYSKEEKDEMFRHLFQFAPWNKLSPEIKEELLLREGGLTRTAAISQNTSIVITNHNGKRFSTEEIDILKRFAYVFEQAYTRFLDLQKAEAQTKEAEIQLALERVRARSLAMHHTNELVDVVVTVFQQLGLLSFNLNGSAIVINLFKENSNDITQWIIDAEHTFPYSFHHPHFDNAILNDIKQAREKQLNYFSNTYTHEEKNNFWNYYFQHTDFKKFPEELKQDILNKESYAQSMALQKHSGILNPNIDGKVLNDEQKEILIRFSKVFEQSYIRFLDLQKAEAQAREAQIELALERVRARTMAMQQSEELQDTSLILFEQLKELGEPAEQCTIGIIKESEGVVEISATLHGNNLQQTFRHKLDEPVVMTKMFKGWKDQQRTLVLEIKEAELQKYNQYRNELVGKLTFPVKLLPDDRWIIHIAYFSRGMLALSTNEPRPPESLQLLERFAIVFEQTYTRFLDLQKAEAQAREAQIEAALERVRSRSMGMQKSDELKGVIQIIFEQFVQLNIKIEHTGFVVEYKPKGDWQFWIADQQKIPNYATVPYFESVWGIGFNEAKEKEIDFFATHLNFEEKNKFYSDLLNLMPGIPEQAMQFYFSCPALAISTALSENVALYIENFSGIPYTDEENVVLMRFCKVFQQTYTRFLDLQKAETQAREAQIEAALEKVRSVALGLKKSDELLDITEVLYNQLFNLGFVNIRNTIIDIHTDDKGGFWDYDYSPEMGKSITKMNYNDHPIIEKQIQKINASTDGFFEIILEGKDLEELIAIRNKNGEAEDERLNKVEQLTYNLYSFGEGEIGISNFGLLEEEQKFLLKRFRNVFSFAYNRYSELKEAESRAREAQIETGLEKVRSRTLAMQNSNELAETAAVLFRQLIALGIEPNRLYIGIVKDESGDMEMWATDEDGTSVGKKFIFNKNENASVLKLYDGWKAQQKSVIVDMEGKELKDYLHYLNDVMQIPFKGGLSQKRRVQSVAYFSKGFIGMASPDGQGNETIQLLERFAAVFNLTFTRFNDLKIAEAHAQQAEEDLIAIKEAKQKAEDALIELQATQKQLIQSEKMASLGELTAGIAHEIQNPLNFVNNFSEVSKELLDEMKTELDKGNIEDARDIMVDVIQNLEKINHHGKRADGIVKGMLQHSRSSSGVKEPTDINALADEYLRLSYHGLRAKDKTFNATIETNFDDNVVKINIIPQDIGRVVLNLLTNAFYVVDEKKKATQPTQRGVYEPTVSISTKKIGDKVEIKVSDNGNGIPQKVLDKIFQPFFTTKPTGQGTGLGLSLSYDIVTKGHGGELKVETKEGEGTTFIMSLPII